MNNMTNNVNSSIRCSVENCVYHAQSQNYCTKNEISVGCCGTNKATNCDSTECASFKMDSSKC